MRTRRFGPGGPFGENEGPDGPRGHGGHEGPRGHGGHGGPGHHGRIGRGGGGDWDRGPRHERGHEHDHNAHDGPRRFRGRTRRGEIRNGLLAILAEAPGHGYEIIQRIEEKTNGAWKPSPGSVYPTLQLLQDEGLVTVEERDAKRIFSLTDAGRAEHEKRSSESGDPWKHGGTGGSERPALFESVKQLHLAARQVGMAGDETQVASAVAIVNDARKKLYQLLAAD